MGPNRAFYERVGHWLEVLWDFGAHGVALIGAMALSLVAVLVVLHGAYFDAGRGSARASNWLCGIVAGGTLVCGFSVVERSRVDWLRLTKPGPTSFEAFRLHAIGYDPYAVAHAATHLTGLWALVMVPALVIAGFRLASSATRRTLLLATGAMLLTTAGAALAQPYTPWWPEGCGDETWMFRGLREDMEIAQRSFNWWRIGVVTSGVASVLACGAAAELDAERSAFVSRRFALGSALVLGIGIVTFVASRARARDARLDVPHRTWSQRCDLSDPAIPQQPSQCEPLTDQIIFGFRGADRYAVPGRVFNGGPFAEENPISTAELVEGLDTYKKAWLEHYRKSQFVGVRSIVASSDTSVASMRLDQFLERGYRLIYLVTRASAARIEGATVGRVTLRSMCCSVPIVLDGNGEPISRYATYGDLVLAAGAARQEERTMLVAP
jgi:hypothetical protein